MIRLCFLMSGVLHRNISIALRAGLVEITAGWVCEVIGRMQWHKVFVNCVFCQRRHIDTFCDLKLRSRFGYSYTCVYFFIWTFRLASIELNERKFLHCLTTCVLFCLFFIGKLAADLMILTLQRRLYVRHGGDEDLSLWQTRERLTRPDEHILFPAPTLAGDYYPNAVKRKTMSFGMGPYVVNSYDLFPAFSRNWDPPPHDLAGTFVACIQIQIGWVACAGMIMDKYDKYPDEST